MIEAVGWMVAGAVVCGAVACIVFEIGLEFIESRRPSHQQIQKILEHGK